MDFLIEDAEINCIEASKHKIISLYFKNNAADKLEENEYLVNVNNWGEIYKYLMLNDVMKRR